MSEVPELRAAVRASAERRCARRRRPAWRVALPLAAAAMVAALVLLGRPANDEVPAVAPAPTPTATPATTDAAQATIGSVFGAFRRPQRATDRTPLLRDANTTRNLTYDLAGVRRLAVTGDYALYGIPGVYRGQVGLCLLTTRGSEPAGAGCGAFDPDEITTHPRWMKTFYRPASLYALLLPDGTDTVQLRLRSGQVLTERVQDNAVLFTVKGLERIVWRDATGVEHSSRATI
jgi:hypothetical protein